MHCPNKITVFHSAAVAVALLSSCGAREADTGTEGDRLHPDLSPYSSQMAALGTATLDCLGTVGPDSYVVDDGRLARSFTTCRTPGGLRNIDNLLGLQGAPGASDVAEYMTTTWQSWQRQFTPARIVECPTWHKVQTLNEGSVENVSALPLGHVGESFVEYSVHSSGCEDAACAVQQAKTCAGGFGPAFIVSVDEATARVVVDPVWWLDDSDFPPETNPYTAPTNPGYYHAMCFYGAPPGAVYGAVERIGEYCCKYYAGYYYKLRLQPVYCAADWICMSECR